jgi:hypothetical protein
MTALASLIRLVDVSELRSWDPALILAPEPTAFWPDSVHETLESLTSKVLATRGFDGPVIRPSDIDVSNGEITVRKSEIREWTFQIGGSGLREGDLLLTDARPVVYVTDALKGFQFSTHFLALRPREGVDSLWIWACLNSTAGISMRESMRRGHAFARTDTSLLNVPTPNESWTELRTVVIDLANALNASLRQIDRGNSWWRVTDLPTDGSWAPLMAAQDPSIFEHGVRLGDLAADIRPGRRPREDSESPEGAGLPVWGAAQLRGRPASAHAHSESGVIAKVDDILIQRTGTRGLAAVVTAPCLVDTSLFVVSLIDSASANDVVVALNSVSGQRQRSFRLSGTTIPSLTPSALGEIRLDFSSPETQTEALPLAQQIDALVLS